MRPNVVKLRAVGAFWLLLNDEEELFVSFPDFPWFSKAPVEQLFHVERPQPHHLYWPELDIDLHVDSIRNPEQFPLVSRVTPNKQGGHRGTEKSSSPFG